MRDKQLMREFERRREESQTVVQTGVPRTHFKCKKCGNYVHYTELVEDINENVCKYCYGE